MLHLRFGYLHFVHLVLAAAVGPLSRPGRRSVGRRPAVLRVLLARHGRRGRRPAAVAVPGHVSARVVHGVLRQHVHVFEILRVSINKFDLMYASNSLNFIHLARLANRIKW